MLGVLWIMFIASCSPYSITPQVTILCRDIPLDTPALLACITLDDTRTLLQSHTEQAVNFNLFTHRLSLQGTALIAADAESGQISVLEGQLVIVGENTRILRRGQLVNLTGGRSADVQFIQERDLIALPLTNLPRFIERSQVILATATTTPSPTPTTPAATVTASNCAANEGWTAIYSVQAGDSLGRIAERYGVSLLRLQTANCISDANRLSVGQILAVPDQIQPTWTPTPTQTPEPITEPLFVAEQEAISSGGCTTLRWELPANTQGTLDTTPITPAGVLRVCPAQTRTYNLTVEQDGNKTTLTLTIRVE